MERGLTGHIISVRNLRFRESKCIVLSPHTAELRPRFSAALEPVPAPAWQPSLSASTPAGMRLPHPTSKAMESRLDTPEDGHTHTHALSVLPAPQPCHTQEVEAGSMHQTRLQRPRLHLDLLANLLALQGLGYSSSESRMASTDHSYDGVRTWVTVPVSTHGGPCP